MAMTVEENERLTRVGPGTPMGDLLRRYWFPVAITSELGPFPKKVRLLGEDLVLYRDLEGRLGLLEEHCPHRRASLSVGCTEPRGLRCAYHGWLFDEEGRCLEQPTEPPTSKFKDTIRTTAYPVEELSGLIFAYLGPEPAPLLPRFDLFVWDNVLRDIGECMLDFNWLQAMENSVDPHHVEWLHGRFMNFYRGIVGDDQVKVVSKKHVKTGFDPFEYGIIKRRVVEGGSEEDDDWKVGHPLVFPYMLRVGGGGLHQFQMRVPIDDTHTWHLWYTVYRPGDHVEVPEQNEIPRYDVPIKDENGEWIIDFIDGQDIVAWATQGPIADRSRENLSKSDRGVVMLRKMFRDQLDRVERGEDPLGVVRDRAMNECIDLPMEENKYGSGAEFREELLNFQAVRHTPIKDEIRAVFAQADKAAASR